MYVMSIEDDEDVLNGQSIEDVMSIEDTSSMDNDCPQWTRPQWTYNVLNGHITSSLDRLRPQWTMIVLIGQIITSSMDMYNI